jgi:CRP/FNR family transcriptional regulator
MQAAQEKTTFDPGENLQGCSFCLINKVGLCGATIEKAYSSAYPASGPLGISRHTIQARQMIHHPKEFSEYVIFLCSGQAVSSVALPDGRRQILEILLPGDVVFWTALFAPMSGRLIEAVEDSTYRKLERTKFQELLLKLPDLFEMFIRLCTHEKIRSDQLALTLGRRNAPQRIARLILNLAERLAERGMMSGQTMKFPLRLRHIGDATGLTPVHTSKILSQFQRAKIINLQGRSLTITNIAELRQVAGP